MLTVLPVVKVEEGQLGCSCPHSQLRVMEVVLETAPRMGLGVPPPAPQSDLHRHCSGGEGSRAATMALIQAMLCLGAVGLQTTPLGRSISPDLCHSQELSGFVGDCGRGRRERGNCHTGCSPEGVVRDQPLSQPLQKY